MRIWRSKGYDLHLSVRRWLGFDANHACVGIVYWKERVLDGFTAHLFPLPWVRLTLEVTWMWIANNPETERQEDVAWEETMALLEGKGEGGDVMDFATGMAFTILVLTPVLLIFEWLHWRQRRRVLREIDEMMNRHREWIHSVLTQEDDP